MTQTTVDTEYLGEGLYVEDDRYHVTFSDFSHSRYLKFMARLMLLKGETQRALQSRAEHRGGHTSSLTSGSVWELNDVCVYFDADDADDARSFLEVLNELARIVKG